MRRDIASAYLAAATKIGSWVVVSAIVYRWYGAGAFAMVSLVRATLSILNYTTLGLAPAMMNVLAKAYQSPSLRNLIVTEPTKTLDYASAEPEKSSYNPIHVIFYNGMLPGWSASGWRSCWLHSTASFLRRFITFPFGASRTTSLSSC